MSHQGRLGFKRRVRKRKKKHGGRRGQARGPEDAMIPTDTGAHPDWN